MTSCSECGGALAEARTEGLCAQCLMQHGLTLATAEAPEPLAFRDNLPRLCGDYELLEEIARGGMGVIYRARQRSLDRLVAVKMLLFGPAASPDYVKRFRAEASAAATLQHSNIVAIHEVGVHQGEHYLVMDLVDGPNLANLVRNEPLPARRAAGYLKTISEAIQYAHERGILHRDLKPSNVLIDGSDQPRVTDFGLAKRLDADSSLTLTGQVLGSPSYMPPEQAGATRHKVGRGADIYSLGAMLYHALVGRPPFVGEGLNQTLRQVMERDPVPPRLLNPAVPRDLETICLKCLEKEPSRRFLSARALAEELGRFLNDEPIHTRPVGAPEKVWRWCRRKPALASLLLLLNLVGALGVGGILWQWRRAEQNLYVANIRLTSQALNEYDIPGTVWPLAQISRSRGQRAMRGWEWRHLVARTQGDQLCILDKQDSAFWGVALSADGQYLATIDANGRVKLWDFPTRKILTNWLAHPPPPRSSSRATEHALVFGADSRTLFTAGPDNRLRVWNIPDATRRAEDRLPDLTIRLALAPDGSRLATGSFFSGQLTLWAVSNGIPSQLHTWTSPLSVLEDVRFSPDGRLLFAGGPTAQSVRPYDISDPTHPRLLPDLDDSDGPMAVSPDGHWLATTRANGQPFRLWSLPSLAPALTNALRSAQVRSLVFSPDSKTLAMGLGDGGIVLWQTGSDHSPVTLLGHEKLVHQLAFSADGKTLVSTSADKTLRLWDATAGPRGQWLATTPGGAHDISFSPDSKKLASVSLILQRSGSNGLNRLCVVQLWNVDEEKGLVPLTSVSNVARGLNFHVSFSPDGRLIAADEYGALRLLQVPTLGSLGVVGERLACWGPHGNWLVYFNGDRIVRTEHPASPPRDLVKVQLESLALSPDGETLAGSGEALNWGIQLWRAKDGQPLGPPMLGHEAWVSFLAFAPDGKTLVSAGWDDGLLGVWDVKHRRQRAMLPVHNDTVYKVAFSPDGATLATCGADETVRLWSLSQLQELAVLRGHGGQVQGVAFSPNGRWLAGAMSDGTIQVWSALTFPELSRAPDK